MSEASSWAEPDRRGISGKPREEQEQSGRRGLRQVIVQDRGRMEVLNWMFYYLMCL